MALNPIDGKIRIKRSNVTGSTPTIAPSVDHTDGSWSSTDIYVGEYFLNTVDDRLWLRTDNAIREIDLFFTTGATDDTTASNGLTKSGENITLGGALTGATFIDNAGFLLRSNTYSATTMSAVTIHVANLSGFSPININDSIHVEQSGNTGIGTTSPTAGKKLHVLGNTKAEGTLLIAPTSPATAGTFQLLTGGGSIFMDGSGSRNRILMQDYAGANTVFQISDSVTSFWNPNGATVGFGFGTDTNFGFNSKIFVKGATATICASFQNSDGSSTSVIEDVNGMTGIGIINPTQKFHVSGTTLLQGAGTGSTTDTLLIQNSAGTTSMLVQDNGLIGVGTSAPNANLHVLSDSTTATGIRVDSTTGTFQFRTLDAGGVTMNDLVTVGSNTANQAVLFIANNASGVARFRVDTDYGANTLFISKDGDVGALCGKVGLGMNPDTGVGGEPFLKVRQQSNENIMGLYTSGSSTPVLFVADDGAIGLNTITPTADIDINGSSGATQLRLRTSFTPSGSGDTAGDIGAIAWDDDFIYTKTNTGWGRTSLDYSF